MAPFDATLPSERSYFLVSRAKEIEIPRIASFRPWVIDQFSGNPRAPELNGASANFRRSAALS